MQEKQGGGIRFWNRPGAVQELPKEKGVKKSQSVREATGNVFLPRFRAN